MTQTTFDKVKRLRSVKNDKKHVKMCLTGELLCSVISKCHNLGNENQEEMLHSMCS